MYAACLASAGALDTSHCSQLTIVSFVQIILELSKSNEKLEVAHSVSQSMTEEYFA